MEYCTEEPPHLFDRKRATIMASICPNVLSLQVVQRRLACSTIADHPFAELLYCLQVEVAGLADSNGTNKLASITTKNAQPYHHNASISDARLTQ